jgi:hypothetical protein
MRVLVPSLACVAALCLTAGSAAAKSSLEVSAVPVTVGGVSTDEISVTASGGDDAAGYQRLCLQQVQGDVWRTLTCGRIELGTGGTVQVFVQRAASESDTFRAEVQRVARDGRGDARLVVDLISSPVQSSAGQRQINSTFAVSLSSVDSGIATASVVRSK